MIDVTIVERGILPLPCILGKEAIVAHLKAGAHIESANILRKIQSIVGSGDDDILIGLVLENV